MTTNTETQKRTLAIVLAVGEAIKAAGSPGVRSGDLYAMLLTPLPSLTADNFSAIIQTLKNVNVMRENNYLLTWSGK